MIFRQWRLFGKSGPPSTEYIRRKKTNQFAKALKSADGQKSMKNDEHYKRRLCRESSVAEGAKARVVKGDEIDKHYTRRFSLFPRKSAEIGKIRRKTTSSTAQHGTLPRKVRKRELTIFYENRQINAACCGRWIPFSTILKAESRVDLSSTTKWNKNPFWSCSSRQMIHDKNSQ